VSTQTPVLTDFFLPVESYTEIPRLALSVDGEDKTGKSHYAIITPPDPLIIVTNDTGTMHVVDKARKKYGRKIAGVLELAYPDPTDYFKTSDLEKEAAAEWRIWKEQWAKTKTGTRLLLKDKSIRTYVVDNATSLWKLCLLAHFGKIKSITQNLREEANSDFQRFFWGLYKGRPDLNIIFIHQTKKEYKENSKGEAQWSGKMERDGFNKIGFAVDMTVRCGWEPAMKDFYTEVIADKATRHGAELVGQRWYARPEEGKDPSHFAYLAMSVYPKTELTPEYWGLR